MKKLVCLMVGLFLVGIVGAANATLIGDTVYAQHYFPDLGTPFSGLATTVVTADTSDLMNPYPATYSVDVNASEIIVSFNRDVIWNSATTFNGLAVWGLDDSSGNILQGITASSSMALYNTSWITFSDSQVNFNWVGLSIANATTFSASLDFGAPVPEPTTMLLLGFGLLGMAGVSRRKN